MHDRIRSLVAMVVLLSPPAQSQALDVSSAAQLDLDRHVEVLVDPCACQSVAQVAAATQFQRGDPTRLAPARTSAAIWLKLTVRNGAPEPLTRWIAVEPAFLHEVSFFRPVAEGSWERSEAGVGVPFSRRELADAQPVFRFALNAGEQRTLYLRIASETVLTPHVTLWDPAVRAQQQARRNWWLGMLTVAYPALFLFSMLLHSATRRRSFLYMGMCIVAHALFVGSINGYAFMLLWPQWPGWAKISANLFGALAVIGYVNFMRGELATRRGPVWADRLVLGLLALATTAGLLVAVPGWHRTTSLAQTTLVVLTIAALSLPALLLWRRRVSKLQKMLSGVVLLQVAWLASRLAESTVPFAPRQANGVDLELLVRLVLVTGVFFYGLAVWIESRRAHAGLLAAAGHDLRAPAVAMLSSAQKLASGRQDVAHASKAIETGVRQQLQVVEELIETTLADPYGDTSIEPEVVLAPVHLHGFLRDIAAQADVLADAQDNQMLLTIDPQLPAVVLLDARRVHQILMNLLSNAAKFTSGGKIGLMARPAGSLSKGTQVVLELVVTDTGRGIAQKELSSIFKPFRRGSNAAGSMGSGLGLDIVRRWTRAMGGRITVSSQLGLGSGFTLRLPVTVSSDAMVHVPASFVSVDDYGSGHLALVADDHIGIHEHLGEILTGAGFEVKFAASGAEAMLLLREHFFSLLVTDQAMPGGSGWEVLAEARKLHGNRIRCVLYSNLPPQPPQDWKHGIRFDAHRIKLLSAASWKQLCQELHIGKV